MRPVLLMILVLAGSAWAQDGPAGRDELLDPGRAEGGARRTLYRVQMQRSRGEVDDARRTLRDHLAKHPDQDHALLHFHLGQVLAQGDSMAAAAWEFEAAVALEPDLWPAWRNLGEVAYGNADFARAAEAFDEAWRLAPDRDEDLRYYQGVALLQAGRAAAAVDVLADLLEDPDEDAPPEWYRALLAAAVDAGRPDRAGPAMDRLTLLHPDDDEAWLLAAQQAAAAEDYPRAVTALTVTGYLRPLTVDERRRLGDLCLAAGAPARAARHFAAVVDSLGGGTPDDLERLVSALLAADRTGEALDVLDRRLQSSPSARLWRLKGELHYGAGEFAAARAAFAEAADLDPADREYDLLQGYCLVETGDRTAARRHLLRAAEDPRLAPRAREGLAYLDALDRQGEAARAEP